MMHQFMVEDCYCIQGKVPTSAKQIQSNKVYGNFFLKSEFVVVLFVKMNVA